MERILKEKVPMKLWWVIMKMGCNITKEDFTKVHSKLGLLWKTKADKEEVDRAMTVFGRDRVFIKK